LLAWLRFFPPQELIRSNGNCWIACYLLEI
jgi:hypothetical protein